MSSDNTPVLEIQASAGTPVELQSGEFVANAAFHRDGADLLLTSPAGETVIIRDYFAQNPPPDIDTADGAHLSPEMVDAFLPPQHIGEYAANTVTANDASPAGQVTETIGDATIVRADGTRVPAEIGTPIYPGDVIETSADGAVNLLFIDNTTFALSENARLSIDEYIYNTADQSGSTLFSMMQGVFVYTSGLVGKNDPGSVNIETPVGSIGIRGTVVAGDINPAGEDSTITIIDGAIVLNNGGGTLELSNSFETAVLSSYQTAPDNIGQISAQSFMQTYNAVSGVAPSTFEAVSGAATTGGDTAAPEATTAPETQTAPEAPVAPVTENQPTTEGTAGETTGTVETAPAQETALPPPPPPPGTETILMPPPPPPGETTTFTGTATTFGTTTNPFLPPPPPPGGTVTFLPPPPPPPPSGDTTLSGATNTNPLPKPALNFTWGTHYLNFTPVNTLDDGIRPFANGLSSLVVGSVNLLNIPASAVIELSGEKGGYTAEYVSASNNDISSTSTLYNSGVFDLQFNNIIGKWELKLLDPFAILPGINSNDSFDLTITAKEYAGGPAITSLDIHVKIYTGDMPFSIVAIGDQSTGSIDPHSVTATSGETLNGDNANNLLWSRAGGDTLLGYAGNDTLIGGTGDDTLVGGDGNDTLFGGVGSDTLQGNTGIDTLNGGAGNDFIKLDNATFDFGQDTVDGGADIDTLRLFGVAFDFTSLPDTQIKNIEKISLESTGSTVILNLSDIFAMTDANSNHTLTITNSFSKTATVDIDTTSWANFNFSSTGGGGVVQIDTYQGSYNNAAVTLVVEHGGSFNGTITVV